MITPNAGQAPATIASNTHIHQSDEPPEEWQELPPL